MSFGDLAFARRFAAADAFFSLHHSDERKTDDGDHRHTARKNQARSKKKEKSARERERERVMAHRSAHAPPDIEMTQLADRTVWDHPVDAYDQEGEDLADVRRCAAPERMCIPRLTRHWAMAWAAVAALVIAALVFGPWVGDRLGPQYALVDRVERWPCVVLNHTVLASWWGHGNALSQVPGVGVRLLRGDDRPASDATALPRLLWHQSWMAAATVAPYFALYPVNATTTCYGDAETRVVALRDGIDDLDMELTTCIVVALFAGALAFWGVYRLLGPRRAS